MTRTLLATLVTLGDPGKLTGGYLYHRRLAERAARNAARLDFVSVPERAFPLAIVASGPVVGNITRSGADVIVLDSIAAAFLGPWLVAREPAVPLVGMLHQPPGGIDHGPARTYLQAILDRAAYKRARRLLVASESLADELIRVGEHPDRVTVVPPGRDVAPASGPAPGDLRQGRHAAFLCVGNWVERKGILQLLEAFAALADESATLHLVGDTNTQPGYGRRVHRRLAQPDLYSRVVIHGPLGVAGVAAMYAAADAFVLPSLKEPYGTVYGEAMAFGLPVVGWRAGNLPYLAENEREGLLVQAGDTTGLTEALRRLAADEHLRAELGEAARNRAMSRPTWDQVAELFFDRLRDVVGEAQARSPL
jgi:glycosyltransferase involved in cell wall biosynthesis